MGLLWDGFVDFVDNFIERSLAPGAAGRCLVDLTDRNARAGHSCINHPARTGASAAIGAPGSLIKLGVINRHKSKDYGCWRRRRELCETQSIPFPPRGLLEI